MPEMPEVQAHAERLTEQFAGLRLKRFRAAHVHRPEDRRAGARRGLRAAPRDRRPARQVPPPRVRAGDVRRPPDAGRPAARRREEVGQAARRVRPGSRSSGRPEAPTRRPAAHRAGHRTQGRRVVRADGEGARQSNRSTRSARRRRRSRPTSWRRGSPRCRIRGCTRSCATSTPIAGLGRRLANEVCHRAKLSPFAMTDKLDAGRGRRDRRRDPRADRRRASPRSASGADMSSSKDRPSRVHNRTGQPCPVCGDAVRAVEYASYTVNYCPTCQTGGKVLADNTTSKFLK